MSLNDSSLARAVRTLHGLAPDVEFDSAKQINDLMRDWWDKMCADAMETPKLSRNENKAITEWILAEMEGKKT